MFGYYGISTIVACEGVTMASVVALWALAYRRGIPGAGPMVVALAANVFAGITRALPSSITELVGLDPVSLYHLAQIPPMALLYVAIIERSAIPAGAGRARRSPSTTTPRHGDAMSPVEVVPARLDWLEALAEGDDVFTARFGIAVEPDWAGFPEAIPLRRRRRPRPFARTRGAASSSSTATTAR